MLAVAQMLVAEMQDNGRLTVLLYIAIGLVALHWMLSHRAVTERDVDRATASVPAKWRTAFRDSLDRLRLSSCYCNSAGIMNVRGLRQARKDFLNSARRETARQKAVRRQDKAFRR